MCMKLHFLGMLKGCYNWFECLFAPFLSLFHFLLYDTRLFDRATPTTEPHPHTHPPPSHTRIPLCVVQEHFQRMRDMFTYVMPPVFASFEKGKERERKKISLIGFVLTIFFELWMPDMEKTV